MAVDIVDPSHTLADLNIFVAQGEKRLIGPLTAIGNANGYTTLTFDETAVANPDPPSQITTGAVPANKVQIGTGQVYVSGTLTNAKAYKP